MKMNRITKFSLITISMALLASAMLFTNGCALFGGGSSGTNAIPQTTIDATAIILRGAARDGAVVAMTPPNGNANNAQYFNLAATSIGAFVTGKDYTPGSFQKALMGVNSPQLHDPYVQIGIGTVVDLYQLYYIQYVQPNVASNAPVALEFLTSIQDGFNEALGNPVSVSKSLKAVRPSGVPGDILPRPIK